MDVTRLSAAMRGNGGEVEMSIQVNDFRWEPGKNDSEYIKLLESSRDEWQKIAQKAIAKLKALSKAQEPVEPKYVEFEDTGLTLEKYEVATCGKCGALLADALYCPMCGQAVKWE